MEENKASRIGFINKSEDGSMWGNLTWDEGRYLIRNIHKEDDGSRVGNIQVETGKTYLNKAGKECKEYKKIGALKFTKDGGELAIQVHPAKPVEKASFIVSLHNNDKGEYLMLSFEEPNPYLQYLGADVHDDVPTAEPDELPDF